MSKKLRKAVNKVPRKRQTPEREPGQSCPTGSAVALKKKAPPHIKSLSPASY